MTDVLIIGAGPAGLTAALYLLRAGLSVTVVEKKIYGGQVAITNKIENYPGIAHISGIDLSNKMFEQVSKMGCKFLFETINSVNLSGNIKKAFTSSKEINARSVIITNGLKRRKLGCRGENEFEGRGVSYCATCDGSLFKGKEVCIVGGGNTALEDALYLSNICSKVTLVVRKNDFRAEKYLVDLVKSKSNIVCEMTACITEICGDEVVKCVKISNSYKSNICKVIDVSAVFIAIGYEPDNGMYEGQIDLDENKYFVSNENCLTNIPGVFVAGDCRKKMLRQIVTAVADGAVAGTQAIRYVLSIKK